METVEPQRRTMLEPIIEEDEDFLLENNLQPILEIEENWADELWDAIQDKKNVSMTWVNAPIEEIDLNKPMLDGPTVLIWRFWLRTIRGK